jgi:Tol biopolymer transport system component
MLAFAGQAPVAGSMYDDNLNQIWIQNLIPPNTNPNNFDTGLHQLDPLQGRTPDWSPNDRFLTFESRRGCLNVNYAIFIEASSTGEATQVTDCKLNANHAVWSPDGRHSPSRPSISSRLKPARQDAAELRSRRYHTAFSSSEPRPKSA